MSWSLKFAYVFLSDTWRLLESKVQVEVELEVEVEGHVLLPRGPLEI